MHAARLDARSQRIKSFEIWPDSTAWFFAPCAYGILSRCTDRSQISKRRYSRTFRRRRKRVAGKRIAHRRPDRLLMKAV